MWSLGAIVAELFLGLPLFPGENEYNQVRLGHAPRLLAPPLTPRLPDPPAPRIMRGPPPDEMLDAASFGHKFFVPKTNGEAAAPAAAEAEKAAAAPAAAAPTAGAQHDGSSRMRRRSPARMASPSRGTRSTSSTRRSPT